MVPDANTSSVARSVGFAHLITGLIAKADRSAGQEVRDALADDVVMLSYEQALRRGRIGRGTAAAQEASTALPADGEAKLAGVEDSPHESGDESHALATAETRATDRPDKEVDGAETRKVASLTVRMSGAECAQVHARAAEAGMTVSAYVRSCVFEAESLRAQVKRALAEMRAGAGQAHGEHGDARGNQGHDSVRGWRSRFFPRWASRNSSAS